MFSLGYLIAAILAILTPFVPPNRFILPVAVLIIAIAELLDHGAKF